MDIVSVQQAGLAADKKYPRKASTIRAQRGLRNTLPSQPPARVPSPTVTLANAAPASTPTFVPALVSGLPSTKFRYSGGPTELSAGAFPYSAYLRQRPAPFYPGSVGGVLVDFMSDSPATTLLLNRAQLGSARILVEDENGKMVEYVSCVPTTRTATAQAGTSTTITLDTGASTLTGYYIGCWVTISAGTGVGQQAQITSYVGSTKVATVDHTWTTTPDATSVFEVTGSKATHTTSTQTGYSTYSFTLDWSGERRMRHYRLELNVFGFYGIYVSSPTDTLQPAPKPTGDICIWGGDSFAVGSGADGGWQSFARITCDLLGWNLLNTAVGGTGYLNDGNSSGSVKSFVLYDRWFPPTNAWHVWPGYNSTGTFTVTQSGTTTASISPSDAIATVQTNFDTTFGTGTFKIGGLGGGEFWALGQGATATSTAVMTANYTSIASGIKLIEQYLGDLAPRVPKDGNGNPEPFKIVLTNGRNDTTGSNALYTQSAVQAAVTTLLNQIYATYPKAEVYMTGILYLPGGTGNASSVVTNCNAGISAAATASLKKINGKLPFFDALAESWTTGTGYRGNLKNDGNGDLVCLSDGTHPTVLGHLCLANRLADDIIELNS